MVGQRCIRPRSDDHRERERVGSLVVEHLLQPPGDLGLGAADELLLGESFVGGVGDARRAADRRELILVLDRAKPRDDAGDGQKLDPVTGDRLVSGDSDVVCLEGDRRLGELSEPRSQPREQVPLGLDGLDPLEGAGGFHVAPVRGQDDTVAADDERCVRALEPAEVADVDGPGDEEGPCTDPVCLSTKPFEASVHPCSFRYASASRYPSGPLPMTRCVTTSARTECRRHSSRFSMSDRCTSTTGAEQSSSASRMA